MTSKKNVWRRAGRIEFRRETKRYSDGSPWGCDTLFIRIKGKACAVVEPFDWSHLKTGQSLSILCDTYQAATPLQAARVARAYLKRKAAGG